MTTVLLALDKFKGSLTATEVCAALERGLLRGQRSGGHPGAAEHGLHVRSVPVADGGDGTVDAALAAGFEPLEVTVSGPLGEPRTARIARRGDVAVVELAECCGLQHVQEPSAETHARASTRGLGEALAAAIADGAREVVVGIGGSASTDLGLGMLAALGASLTDDDGRLLPDGSAALRSLASADLTEARKAVQGVCLTVASDVTSPLTGPQGAAHVFAAQKGAHADTLEELDADLARAAGVLMEAASTDLTSRPGAGAAGGTGQALMLLGGRARSGAEVLLNMADFDHAVADADVLIVGEGSLDGQSLQGKAPAVAAVRARTVWAQGACSRSRTDRTVLAVAGRTDLSPADVAATGIDRVLTLRERASSDEDSIARAAEHLEDLGRELARDLGRDPA
ncbi:glycerate kinase [Micrococcus luteus]